MIELADAPATSRAARKTATRAAQAGGAAARERGKRGSPGWTARSALFLYQLAIVLWVGSLLTVGYLVAPSLFGMLSGNRALAGEIAGVLFTRTAWLGLGCAAYVLLFLAFRQGAGVWKSAPFWIACLMVGLVLLGQFGVQPVLAQLKDQARPLEVMKSVLADRFATWHGIS
ncbi:MAG: DUF4149 domain-containing protein, partial [Rhodocyclaceae bacterium]|nr:DUF4149 domain-containing protein [Rhodocyclaceae bacterium]